MIPRRVMIVDDVPQVRADLRTLLSLSGDVQVVAEAANGLEALQMAASASPDVALMDLEMPILDGYQAARRLKAQSPGCRIIALTVHGYPEAQAKACQAGVDAFIIKGAPLADLVAEILKETAGCRKQPDEMRPSEMRPSMETGHSEETL